MKSDEQFEITSDEHLIDAIMWTLHPPLEQKCKRDLTGEETVNSVASGMWVLFHDFVKTAINLGMHNCMGITVRIAS